ncbi:MAG TPA: helix-turn-helix domain-containing protein [Firmicutes bacterium]|nr:helix-turn-helix domain-containing protein [Candidatus Fermentithermobacillaceae bacterium]
MKKVLTPEEVAGILGLSRRTIVGWLECGKLSGVKLGNRWRVKEEDLEKFINEPNMYFADYTHHRRFIQMQSVLNSTERELVACVYILSYLSKPLDRFIAEGSIDIQGIKQAVRLWGGVESALVEAALNLLDPTEPADIHDVFSRLDHKGIEVLMQALRLRW